MRPIFPLLLLPLFLVACALPVRDGAVLRAPQENPTAKTAQEGPGAFGRVAGQETQNGVFLMGETGQIQATSGPSATAGPNLQATIDAMVRYQIDVTVTARADAMLIAKYTATQQAFDNAAVVASQTAQKPASTATKAAQEAEATQQTAYITQSAFIVYATQNAPAQELDAAETRAQASTALFRAMAGPLSILVLLVFVTACLIYVIRNPRPGAAVEAEPQERDEFPELQKLGRPIIQSSDSSLDTDTNPPGDPVRFAELLGYAVDGGALGIGSVMASKIYTNHSEYIPVLEWLRKNNERREKRVPPLPSLLQTEKSGKLSLTPAGQQWATDWLYAHQIPPSLPLGNAENSANNGHARDDNGVIEAGEVDGEQE